MTTEATHAANLAELRTLLMGSRFSFLALAKTMLSADLAVPGWTENTVRQVLDRKASGDRIVLEIGADALDTVMVALVAVSPTGDRQELGRVSENAPGRAN